MNKIPSNTDERYLTSQQLMDRGEARGRVEAARETWLEVARLLLPQATADALESQPTEVIRAAVEATTRK